MSSNAAPVALQSPVEAWRGHAQRPVSNSSMSSDVFNKSLVQNEPSLL